MFIILGIVFVGIGCFYLTQSNYANFAKGNDPATSSSTMHLQSQPQNQNQNIEFDIENLKPAIPAIASMIALSVVLAIVFLLLLMKFPKCMFYTMLAVTTLLMIVLAIVCFAQGIIVMGIIILVALFFFGCFLYCCRDQIEIGIVLLGLASRFIKEKPTVLLSPFFMMIFVIIFEAFWLASFVGIVLYEGDAKT